MQKNINFDDFDFIDLTHTLTEEIATWNGCCGFVSQVKRDYEDNETAVKFRVQQLSMNAGIGTHIDAPAHCFPNGQTIEEIALRKLIVPCIKIDVSKKADEKYQIIKQDIDEFEAKYGLIPKNVLTIFYTGWDQFWLEPTKYRNNYCFPTVAMSAVEILLQREVCGIAIDTLSPDTPESGFPVHQSILGAGKYIIENLANAALMPPRGAYTIISPLKIKGGTESPVRVIGIISLAKDEADTTLGHSLI